jgi:uncharacterized RDD family membrane protein YckC
VVDFLLFSMVFFPVTKAVKGVWVLSATDHRWDRGLFVTDPLCIAFLAVMLLYFACFEGLLGATCGKWAAGLQVIRVEGGKPGLRRSFIRNILRIVDGLPAFSVLGIVLVLASPEKARFGDLVAGTRVIYKTEQ